MSPTFWVAPTPTSLLALALIHHLAIVRNVPLPRIADLFAALAPNLIVEWVGRDDPMVSRLLATREDVFRDYDDAGFRAAFGRRFRVAEELDRCPAPPVSCSEWSGWDDSLEGTAGMPTDERGPPPRPSPPPLV